MANEVLEDDDRAMVSPTTPARRTSPSPRRERRRSRPRRPRRDANAVGEVELHEVVVREPEPNDGAEAGKTDELEEEVSSEESDSSASTDSVFFCRICLDAILPSVVERGDATHLGCACVGGYMHRICALEYLSKKRATHALTCEVCLTQMTKLKSVQQDRLAERRRAGRARRALLTINGADGDDVRRAQNDNSENDDTLRFEVDDPRHRTIAWGSRNPCMWFLWILTRPLAVVLWVSARRLFFVPVSVYHFYPLLLSIPSITRSHSNTLE